MKKIFACTLIALGCMAGTAHASQGEVRFIGSVTDITCDIVPDVGGAVKDTVQLGRVAIGSVADVVNFKLAPNPTGDECLGLTGKTANIAWTGNFTEAGLANHTGTATDAWVKIDAVNSEGTNKAITSTNTASDWTGDKLLSEGAQFTAQLNGGNVAGNFETAAAFVVSYK
ncbi:MAG: hypothetical protein ACRCWR_02400 [Saezia sp.]